MSHSHRMWIQGSHVSETTEPGRFHKVNLMNYPQARTQLQQNIYCQKKKYIGIIFLFACESNELLNYTLVMLGGLFFEKFFFLKFLQMYKRKGS